MRNRYVDLLRALAIGRVVVYHTTGWAFLTVLFPAMSVMFALGGSLMAASLDRTGPAAVGRRLRRLLPSLWVVAVLFVPAMLLTGLPVSWRLVFWVVPVADPPVNDWGALALSVIWYLRDYLWFVLASPVALWLFRRAPVPVLVAPYALLALVSLGVVPSSPAVRDFGLYFGAWLLGFAHHDGMLRRLSVRVVVPVAVVLAAGGAWWTLTHPGPRGYDLNDIPLGNALWSAAFMLVLLRFVPAFTGGGRLVTVLNSRALTIYLWHMPIVIAVGLLGLGVGWRMLLVATLVAVAVLLFGWVEDVAARRRPALVPGRRRTAGSGAAPPAGTVGSGAAAAGSNHPVGPVPAEELVDARR